MLGVVKNAQQDSRKVAEVLHANSLCLRKDHKQSWKEAGCIHVAADRRGLASKLGECIATAARYRTDYGWHKDRLGCDSPVPGLDMVGTAT